MMRYSTTGPTTGPVLAGLLALLLLASPGILADDDEPAFSGRAEFGSDGLTIPIAWGDADGDGLPDLAVGNLAVAGFPPNQLWWNNGDGTFSVQNAFGAAFTFALAWADYDNDGDPDMAVGNFGTNGLYENVGIGSFTNHAILGAGLTIAVAWADADLDGDLDLAVGNGLLGVAQQNLLWVNNGDGTFTQVAAFGTGQTATLSWGDYDRDGDPDLAVGNGGFGFEGQNYLYVNNGDGTFSEVEAFGGQDTASVAWGDANGDGLLDLAVANWDGGFDHDPQSYLYLNDGDGTFTRRLAFGARDTNTVAWADVDLDGDLDLATGNGNFDVADQNFLYLNNGQGIFQEVPQFGLGSTDSIAFADYDGDGDLDAAIGNEHSPTQNELWVNNLDEDRYLRLELIGRFAQDGAGYSNRDAVGAAVEIYPAGKLGNKGQLLGYREVSAHGGFSSQNERTVTFGLGNVREVDVRIAWPGSDGTSIVQCLYDVDDGKSLTVVEDSSPMFACTNPDD